MQDIPERQQKSLDLWVSQSVPDLASQTTGYDLTVREEGDGDLRVSIVGYDGLEPRIGVGSAEVIVAQDGSVTAWHGAAVPL